MEAKRAAIATFFISVISLSGTDFLPAGFASPTGQAQDAGQPGVARRIGAIKTINGNVITLAPDSGPEIAVTVQPNARLLRIAPGAKDLTNATPVQLQDLEVGDRVRVRGQASADATSIAALEVIVISHSDLEARHEQERQDWQKRGLGGLVSAVDAAAGTVTISVSSLGGKKAIVVRTSGGTVIRRYAPDSAKPENAKLSTLQEIQVGDQLRARGDRSADGSELVAEEIFAGIFPTFSGLIKSVDAGAGTISFQDVVSKKTVQMRITTDSQLHKIPAEMAQGIAMGVKGTMPNGMPGAATKSPSSSSPPSASNEPATPNGAPSVGMGQSRRMGNGIRPGGGLDLQRRLDQTPPIALADLHKGDAIVVLSTQGTPSGGSTVIKLFSGVEPILQAAPTGSQAMMLAPWSLGGAPTGDAGP